MLLNGNQLGDERLESCPHVTTSKLSPDINILGNKGSANFLTEVLFP
jgi:hypothetical protein